MTSRETYNFMDALFRYVFLLPVRWVLSSPNGLDEVEHIFALFLPVCFIRDVYSASLFQAIPLSLSHTQAVALVM